MTVSVFDAAKYLCDTSGKTLTNLQLQKLLYLANMQFIATHDKPLINEHFEAWDYGPVQPDLYHNIKTYGSKPVRMIFHKTSEIDSSSEEGACLQQAYDMLGDKPPFWLVSVTHWEGGAWAKRYEPGFMNSRISFTDILEEIQNRLDVREKQNKEAATA